MYRHLSVMNIIVHFVTRSQYTYRKKKKEEEKRSYYPVLKKTNL